MGRKRLYFTAQERQKARRKSSDLWISKNLDKVQAYESNRRIGDRYTRRLEKRRVARYWIKSKYGLSKEDYDKMLIEQGGLCALCKKV
jgi:hypothetical protein